MNCLLCNRPYRQNGFMSLPDCDCTNAVEGKAHSAPEPNSNTLLAALDTMLYHAQTLRIQQVQATAEWEQHHRDKADAAWKVINDTHRQAMEGTAQCWPAASVTLSRRELESLCWEVKVRLRNEPTYDKANLLADLEAWLRERGVEVSDV